MISSSQYNKLVDRKVHFFLLLRNKKYARKGTREFVQLTETAKINTFTVNKIYYYKVGKAKHVANKKIHGWQNKICCKQEVTRWQHKACCKEEATRLAKQTML
jgi:hypothetical protein